MHVRALQEGDALLHERGGLAAQSNTLLQTTMWGVTGSLLHPSLEDECSLLLLGQEMPHVYLTATPSLTQTEKSLTSLSMAGDNSTLPALNTKVRY